MKSKKIFFPIVFFSLFMVEQTTAQVLLSIKPGNLTWNLKPFKTDKLYFKKLLRKGFENKPSIELINKYPTPKAELLSTTEKYDIYKLPLDNMPCLVAKKMFRGNMQTMEQTFKNRDAEGFNNIPNPFKKEILIPKIK